MERQESYTPSWPSECPFSDVGCTVILNSKLEYQTHLTKEVERHLQMVTDLHNYALTGERPRQEANEDPKTKEDQASKDTHSSVDKLKAIESEIDFLTDVLSGYGISQLPALECIKTQLKMPEVGILTLGDSCTFRLVNVSHHRETGQKWLSPHFSVRDDHKMCLAVYPNGLGSGEDTHLSLKLLLLFDDQLEWPITLPSHLGIRVELLIESDGLFEDADSAFDEDPMTAVRAPSTNSHPLEFTWKPRGDRRSSSSSPSPKSPRLKTSLTFDKRYSTFNRKTPINPSLVRRASFNEKSSVSRKSITREESQKRLSRILPPWCQQPAQSSVASISEKTNGTDNIDGNSRRENSREVTSPLSRSIRSANKGSETTETESTSSHEDEIETKSIRKVMKQEKKESKIKPASSPLDLSGDGVDGATVFSMEKFATHEQIDKYTQEYNSLVFQITLCLV